MTSVSVRRKSEPARDVLTKALEEADELVCKVGWFSSSVYPNGTPVAHVAAIHEFGYPPKNIPPRLGFREMARAKSKSWQAVATKVGKRIVSGKMTMYDALDLIGGVAEGDLRKQISEVTSPPLAEATIEARRKRSASGEARTATGAKPLVDTGYMLATATHLVTDNKGDGE